MVEEPIPTAAIVHKDHDHQRHPEREKDEEYDQQNFHLDAGLYAEILQSGGGTNLGYLKKRGAQLQAASGGALEDNV